MKQIEELKFQKLTFELQNYILKSANQKLDLLFQDFQPHYKVYLPKEKQLYQKHDLQ
mgnify:CR=1 FL=1